MKYVGEAIRNNAFGQRTDNPNMVLLGISNWCTVTGHDKLIRNRVKNLNKLLDIVHD